jgi:hypothetical protein
MFSNLTGKIFLALPILSVLAATAARAQNIPNPVLQLTGTENFEADHKKFVRYKFDVFNKEAFPPGLFAVGNSRPAARTRKHHERGSTSMPKMASASGDFAR